MNKEEKRLMLADDLTAYIYEKHTQEECTGFADGYEAALRKVENLNLACVTKQSEQLRFLIDSFQTPKGNHLIDLLMRREEEQKP